MRVKRILIALCVLIGAVTAGATPMVQGGLGSASTYRSMILDLDFPDLQIETVVEDGVGYQEITIPDLASTAEVGSPQVPVKAMMLGAVDGRAQVTVLESSYRMVRDLYPYPSPAMTLGEVGASRSVETQFALDADVYGTDALFPGRLTEVHPLGMIRDQAVVQLRIYPLQVNALTGEARFYHHLRLQVSFAVDPPSGSTRKAGGADFERVLQETLVNYEALGRSAMVQPESLDSTILETEAAAVPGDALKISVTENGLYAVTLDDLQNAGVVSTETIDPSTFRLTVGGIEIPILVEGEGDGSFDAGDEILFYGTAITDVFTVENVYWLTYGGAEGLRMDERAAGPGSAEVPTEFYNSLHGEEDSLYWISVPDGEGQDHYFWDILYAPDSQTYSVSLDNIAALDDSAEVQVTLRGVTDAAIAPDHHTQISLNGTIISDELWNGQIEFQHQVSISQTLLLEGSNSLTVESVGDTGASADSVFHNWFEINYWDTYVAEDDLLVFGCPNADLFKFQVTGYSGDVIEAYDITDPLNVAHITGSEIELLGSDYLVRFQDDCSEDTRYLALTPDQRKSPAAVVLDEPSDLISTTNAADYVIITHPEFYNASLSLEAHRESQGLQVETVKIDDVYDEFNYGVKNPQTIRDFLQHAYENWSVAPEYVLLVGDANMDYKDSQGKGNPDFVPTHLINTDVVGETPTDNWYVCVSGNDILPDMFLGRISVQTSADADAVVSKIIAYEQAPQPGDWNRGVLLVADDDELVFEEHSAELAALLPGGFVAHNVYASDYEGDDAGINAEVMNVIDSGVVIASYTGHGNVDRWATEHILDTADIVSLNNGAMLPFVTTANCFNGFYAHFDPNYVYSLAEEFVRVANKGALAAWSPSGLGHPSGHRVMMHNLYSVIFDTGDHVLGSATTTAKLLTYSDFPFLTEPLQTFILFGDPASRLNLPPYPTVTVISPAEGLVNTSVSAVITGTDFVGGAAVALIQSTDLIAGTDVTMLGPTQINATFDLSGANLGYWDLRVTNPDGLYDTLPNGFRVRWLPVYLPLVTSD